MTEYRKKLLVFGNQIADSMATELPESDRHIDLAFTPRNLINAGQEAMERIRRGECQADSSGATCAQNQ